MKRIICVLIACIASSAVAVSTSYWSQSSANDFKTGTLENVVATNLGELKLSRAIKTLMEEEPRISTVNNMIEGTDGTIYAATGPNAVLLQINDQKVTKLGEIPDATEVLSLAIDSAGRLMVGTSGSNGMVYRFEKPGEKPTAIAMPQGVQYVWALQATADGKVYAATGPTGKLFEIAPAGQVKTLLETDENNLLSLGSDGKNLLYVGTDPHGLVYRVNRMTGESFVLYNAAEADVTALALDGAGNLYAATGEAREEQPNTGGPSPDPGKTGSPEGGSTGVPIPGGGGPDEPKPPAAPDPNPGRPNPIPKGPQARAARKSIFEAALTCREALKLAKLPHGSDRGTHGPDAGLIGVDVDGPNILLASDDEAAVLDDKGPGKPKPPIPGQPQHPATAPAVEQPTPPRQPQVDTGATGEPRPEGNAVYKIDPNGFVTEVFRQPVLVLSMVERNGLLLIGTGSDGQIFQVNPQAEETEVLAKVDAKQVTCLLSAKDGQIYVGMSNVGGIATMSEGLATRGTYISPVLDATQISRFGKLQMHGSLPPDTSLMVSTRSGNVKEASDKTWSKWSDDVRATQFLPVASPSARFLQYRLTLTSDAGKQTPVVDDVTIAYQIPNLPPQVKAIKVATAGDAATQSSIAGSAAAAADAHSSPNPTVTIAWDASDPNNDSLIYSLYFRRGSESPWIMLAEKLRDATYEWDTRSVADGRYQVKVIASDSASNAPGEGKSTSRVSDPIIVDNTPPVIGDLKWKQNGPAVHIDLRAADRTSTVAAVDYAVDSSKDWQLVLPVDKIYDNPEATVSFDLTNLSPGTHQVALRATDSKGNQAFENLIVKVEGPAASR